MSESNLAKIAITAESNAELERAADRINEGFEGGRVTKTDVASTLILRAIAALDDEGIDEIRRANFNQVAYLETLLKKLKATGRDSLNTDEAATLQAVLGTPSPKRKSRQIKANESEAPEVTS